PSKQLNRVRFPANASNHSLHKSTYYVPRVPIRPMPLTCPLRLCPGNGLAWLSDVFSHRFYSVGSPQCSCSPFCSEPLCILRVCGRAGACEGGCVISCPRERE